MFLCLCLVITVVNGFSFENDEPQCLSRFDYDYKVLQKLVELENKQTQQQETIVQQQNELNKLRRHLPSKGTSFVFLKNKKKSKKDQRL